MYIYTYEIYLISRAARRLGRAARAAALGGTAASGGTAARADPLKNIQPGPIVTSCRLPGRRCRPGPA